MRWLRRLPATELQAGEDGGYAPALAVPSVLRRVCSSCSPASRLKADTESVAYLISPAVIA